MGTALALAMLFAACREPKGPVSAAEVGAVVEQLSRPGKREAAAQRLAQTDPMLAWPPLEAMVRDAGGTADARLAALAILEKDAERIGLPSAAAIAAARDPSADVRREARRLVAASGDPDLAIPLRAALAGATDPDETRALQETLRGLASNEARWHRRKMLDASTTSEERGLAARKLGAIGGAEDVRFLVERYRTDGDVFVRVESLLAVAALGGEEAAVFVRGELGSPDATLRAIAAQSEVMLRDPAAVPELARILANDPVADARIGAVHALAAIGGDSARIALRTHCESNPPVPDARLREACARARSTKEK